MVPLETSSTLLHFDFATNSTSMVAVQTCEMEATLVLFSVGP